MKYILREVTCLRSVRGTRVELAHTQASDSHPVSLLPVVGSAIEVLPALPQCCWHHPSASLTLPGITLPTSLCHPTHSSPLPQCPSQSPMAPSSTNPYGAMCRPCLWGFGYQCRWAQREKALIQIWFQISVLAFNHSRLIRIIFYTYEVL